MALTKIRIRGFKSIDDQIITLKDQNYFIGENGVGKTNIIEAVLYLYDNLTSNNLRDDVFDINNKFSNEIVIELWYCTETIGSILPSKMGSNTGSYLSFVKGLQNSTESNPNLIKVEFRQIKFKKAKWNISYEGRAAIKNLFPVYFMNSNHANSLDWTPVWNLISDIVKLQLTDQKDIIDKINKLITENDKSSSNFEEIDIVLRRLNLDFTEWKPDQFGKGISQVYYNGNQFINNNRTLDKYSTGSIVLVYYQLFFNLITILAKKKIKFPLILIDEAEIYLHHKHIDRWHESMEKLPSTVTTLTSTHSSRLIKNVIVSLRETSVIQVTLDKYYSRYNNLSLFNSLDKRFRYRLTEEHGSAYFSSSMLLVEGETELEVFKNINLKKIYPILSKIDIFKAMTDDVIKSKISPINTKSTIPYIALVDLDKVINFSPCGDNKMKASIDKTLLSLVDVKRERMNFLKNDNDILNHSLRKRIDSICAAVEFSVEQNELGVMIKSAKDPLFFNLLDIINAYLMRYNIYTFETTIEGSIINTYTLGYVKDFIIYCSDINLVGKHEKQIEKIKTRMAEKFDIISKFGKNTELNFYRMLFDGKSDYLEKSLLKKVNSANEIVNSVIFFNECLGDRANGKTLWITDFLNFYFNSVIKEYYEFSVNKTSKYNFADPGSMFEVSIVRDPRIIHFIYQRFSDDFIELDYLIARLAN